MADIVHRIEVAAAPASLYPFVSGGQGFRAACADGRTPGPLFLARSLAT